MNPYLNFVESIEAGVKAAKGICVDASSPSRIVSDGDVASTVTADSKVLLFAPHPDDECITGLLPLRLMREAGMQVINVPITFGSNEARRPGRAAELKAACDYLGWSILDRNGFQGLEEDEP